MLCILVLFLDAVHKYFLCVHCVNCCAWFGIKCTAYFEKKGHDGLYLIFVIGLFNDAVSCADYVALNVRMMTGESVELRKTARNFSC